MADNTIGSPRTVRENLLQALRAASRPLSAPELALAIAQMPVRIEISCAGDGCALEIPAPGRVLEHHRDHHVALRPTRAADIRWPLRQMEAEGLVGRLRTSRGVWWAYTPETDQDEDLNYTAPLKVDRAMGEQR